MATETVLTDDRIKEIAGINEDSKNTWRASVDIDLARAIEQAVLLSPELARWIDVKKGEPHGEGQYVVRINKHGHIRLGQRVLNSDTLRHQWQVDGARCATVTHFLPIPSLRITGQS